VPRAVYTAQARFRIGGPGRYTRRFHAHTVSTVNRRTAIGAALAAGLAALASGGCGQKGPLFLPEEKLEELERKREELEHEREGRQAPRTSLPPPADSARHDV
jgi:predicted small lipoprotein YifL